MKSIFISSTAKDLGDHRAAVKAAIERLDLRPIDMRNFGSQHGGAVGVSVREVGKANIFVGILAQRYGYVPEGMTKSVTEQEYDEAIRLRLPRLMYLLDETHPWDTAFVENDALAQERLKAFKDRVNANEVRSLFTTPENLAQQVTADVVKLLDKQRRQTTITQILAAALVVVGLIALVLVADPGMRDQAFKIVGIASPTPTPTATYTPTFTPLPTLTPTNTPTPMPTALAGTPFADDVIGVVLADFVNDEPGVNNLGDPLALAFRQQGIPFIRVRHTLADRAEAQQVSDLYNATIVVWGEKYSTGVQVNYEVDPPRSQITRTVDNLLIAVDQDFSTFVINEGMGVPYLLNFTQGQTLYFDGDYSAALDAFNRAVQDIPVGKEAEAQAGVLYSYRGSIYSDIGRDEDALADYTRALELNPDYALAYNNRGGVYYDLGRYEDALADLTRALELDSEYAPVYRNRCSLYILRGELEKALEDCTRAIEFAPNDPESYSMRGTMNNMLGNYKQALADYRTYERLTGRLELIMQMQIPNLERALTSTPAR